jgi:DNA-binding XRE family transcriptional regulator
MTMEQVRSLRTRLGLSQADVARAAGVSRFTLSVCESGHANLRSEHLAAVTRFLA